MTTEIDKLIMNIVDKEKEMELWQVELAYMVRYVKVHPDAEYVFEQKMARLKSEIKHAKLVTEKMRSRIAIFEILMDFEEFKLRSE